MKNFKKFTLVLLLVFVLFTAVGCKKDKDEPFEKGDDGMAKLTYPDLPHTGNEKNSWEYIENESLKSKWYVDILALPECILGIQNGIKDSRVFVTFHS